MKTPANNQPTSAQIIAGCCCGSSMTQRCDRARVSDTSYAVVWGTPLLEPVPMRALFLCNNIQNSHVLTHTTHRGYHSMPAMK